MSIREFADRAEVGESTVRDFEKSRRAPTPESMRRITETFERLGVRMVFQDDGTPLGIHFH